MDLTTRSPRHLGKLFAAYNVLAGTIWLARAGWSPLAGAAFGGHLLLAGGLLLWARGLDRGNRFGDNGAAGQVLSILWPWLLWLLAWTEIGWLFRAAVPTYHDPAIAQLDLNVFGVHWNELLPRLWAGAGWQEAITGVYLSYYFLIVGPPVILAVRWRRAAFMDHTLGLMLAYLGCFSIYLLLPVHGPREAAIAAGNPATIEALGYLSRLMHAVFAAGDSTGTAFPSSHCAGATAAALLCHRHFGRRAGLACGIWAGLIVISTIHTNNHYAIDGLAGVGLAGLVCFKGVRRETHIGHRSHGLHRAASRAATHPTGTPAADSGARSGQSGPAL
jgi:membrane-associated phospholipid phosphatase